jgi:hypothetical protein
MIISSFADSLLEQHQYQGNTNDCGPYCAAEVISLLNHSSRAGSEVSKAMEALWRQGEFLPVFRKFRNWATMPWGIRDALREEGIPAYWKVRQKPDDLLRMLKENSIPIVLVGTFRPMWSHYKILAAFNPSRGYGFVDSAYKKKALRWDSAAYFEKRWKNYGSQVIQVLPYGVESKGSG